MLIVQFLNNIPVIITFYGCFSGTTRVKNTSHHSVLSQWLYLHATLTVLLGCSTGLYWPCLNMLAQKLLCSAPGFSMTKGSLCLLMSTQTPKQSSWWQVACLDKLLLLQSNNDYILLFILAAFILFTFLTFLEGTSEQGRAQSSFSPTLSHNNIALAREQTTSSRFVIVWLGSPILRLLFFEFE